MAARSHCLAQSMQCIASGTGMVNHVHNLYDFGAALDVRELLISVGATGPESLHSMASLYGSPDGPRPQF